MKRVNVESGKKNQTSKRVWEISFLRFNLIETDLQVIMAHSEGQFESNKLGEAENLLYLSVSGI